MILTTIDDRLLIAAVTRAARPDEEVVHAVARVVLALEFGFPRLAVQRPGERLLVGADGPVAPVRIGEDTLAQWRGMWRHHGWPLTWSEFLVRRLRADLRGSRDPTPVELALRDLSHVLGQALPEALPGLIRRVLEFPYAYVDGVALESLTGLSSAALKARFRRRGLPSPFSYLRWIRCLAVAMQLRDGRTVADTARRLGWANSGNLCRHVATTAGCQPSALAEDGAWEALLVRFAEDFLAPVTVERWAELDDLFLRDVA